MLGSELRLRVYASPASAALNLVGEPDSLIVGIERDAGGNLESPASDIFAEAGFLKERDVAGNRMHRRAWPMEEALAEPTATAASIWEALALTNVGPWAGDAPSPHLRHRTRIRGDPANQPSPEGSATTHTAPDAATLRTSISSPPNR